MKDPAGAVFAALADQTRRRVVHELSKDGPLTATELASLLIPPARAWRAQSNPTTSQRSVWNRRGPLDSVRAYEDSTAPDPWPVAGICP